jgi:hypothetical protein
VSADPTLDELDAFLVVMYPMTWECTSPDNQQSRRDMYRKAIAAAIAQARRNDAIARKDHPEWKDGYRDGLTAARSLVQTAAEQPASPQANADTLAILDAMISSQVLT